MKDMLALIITSSSDPNKVSLFIKSIVAFAVFLGVDSIIADEGAGHIINLISAVGMGITAITGLIGLGRKVKLGQWSAK